MNCGLHLLNISNFRAIKSILCGLELERQMFNIIYSYAIKLCRIDIDKSNSIERFNIL